MTDQPRGAKARPTLYETRGRVEAISGDQVNFSHEPVPWLGWPAMTTTFRLDPPVLAKGIEVGDWVAFRFENRPDVPVVHRLASADA